MSPDPDDAVPDFPDRHPHEPVDPDIDLRDPAEAEERARVPLSVVAAVSVGGVIGALARYGAGLLWPTAPDAFPWTTLGINVLGCAVIGVVLVLVSEVYTTHHLVRPFVATGILGGFTTFSTYVVDMRRLIAGGHAPTALAYGVCTLAGALGAVWLAANATRRAVKAA